MSGISLTASMRSNLLSLQNIARQQDIVQNRLATGLKVSSAIDNPSSYYTASSLNNRAADLTALLDAMSQGVQTIKAVSEAIDSGTKFLEQAKAVANQALETAAVKLDKSWFVEQAGADGAVVETAQELKDAVAAGKGLIVVYGSISLDNETITLQNGQKLVGTEYFKDVDSNAGYRNADGTRFSHLEISFEGSGSSVKTVGNNLIADLSVSYTNYQNTMAGAVGISGRGNIIQNVDLSMRGTDNGGAVRGALYNEGEVTLHGKINLSALEGNNVNGIGVYQGHTTIAEDAEVNIQVNSVYSSGIINYTNSILDVYGHISIKMADDKHNSPAIINNSGSFSGNQTNFYHNSELYLYNDKTWIENRKNNLLSIEAGCKIGGNGFYFQSAGFEDDTVAGITYIDVSYLQNHKTEFLKIVNFRAVEDSRLQNVRDTENFSAQYNQILEQYSALVADSGYKGINLLLAQNLKINFNEDRSSKIEVKGVNAGTENLGLTTADWEAAADVEQSISELENAISTLRSFASEFGNYYSIVTTRQDFTENLINVLEEGADKLTLADMNQESANMLALQTSQQLAVNSLSLASQASQSILRLF